MENYARLTAELADRLGCTAVVGHSMGANVALEMAGSGAFTGPVVLLAPSFSRRDEAMIIRVVDRLARVLGRLPFAAMRFMMRFAVKGSPLPPDRLAELVAELQKNDPEFMRRGIHRYLQYLDRHGSVAHGCARRRCRPGSSTARPATAGSPTRSDAPCRPTRGSASSRSPGRSFFTPNEEPALVAGLVVAALAAATQPTTN